MGVLIGLIAVSVNRFNEQLKMTGDVNQELNEWFAFRSNLWSELYTCDSITTQEGELLMYINGKTIKYKLDEDKVMRSTGFDWQETTAKQNLFVWRKWMSIKRLFSTFIGKVS